MIGWNTIDFILEWVVVPFVIVCDLGAHAVLQRRVLLTTGLESLIQPLRLVSWYFFLEEKSWIEVTLRQWFGNSVFEMITV